MDSLFSDIRASCSAGTWSKGIELSRANLVTGVIEEDGEVELRVAIPGNAVGLTVYLYLDDDDWSCDCNHPEDACPHVVGSVIALRQARRNGEKLPGPKYADAGYIEYRLHENQQFLHLERWIVGKTERRVTTALTSYVQRGERPIVAPSQQDLKIDVLLGASGDGPLARHIIHDLFSNLLDCHRVYFEKKEAVFGESGTGLAIFVEKLPQGYRLRMQQSERVERVFKNGAFLTQGKLCALIDPHLGFHRVEKLREGILYGEDALGTIISDVVPEFEEHFEIVLPREKIPNRIKSSCRLHFQTRRDGEYLEVLAHIVYGDPPMARVDGDTLKSLDPDHIPQRHRGKEKRLLLTLRDEWGLEAGIWERMRGADAMHFSERLQNEKGAEIVLQGEAHRAFREARPLQVRFHKEGDGALPLFFESEVTGNLTAARARVSSQQVLEAWDRGESHILLEGGGLAALPGPWLQQMAGPLRDLLAAKRELGEQNSMPRWAEQELDTLFQSLDAVTYDDFRKNFIQEEAELQSNDGEEDLEPLRDYQRDGVRWLRNHARLGSGALLADDMGLGKTVQTLFALRGKSLVVCPTSVLRGWEREANRFRPSLKTKIFHGSKRSLEGDWDILLTTYALLRIDQETLAARDWGTVVLDEAHTIKNPSSQIAQAAFSLKSKNRFCLSGTPVENTLQDLWSQFHFLNRGLLGGRAHFKERYQRPIAEGQKSVTLRLRQRVSPFILRRAKKDVALELPSRTEMVLDVALEKEEREIYAMVQSSVRQDIVGRVAKGEDTLKLLEALLRLRQAACDRSLIPGQEASTGLPSSKIQLLVEQLLVGGENGHRALVFSQWTKLLDRVEPHLRRAGIPFSRLDGSTGDRQAVVDEFQEVGGPQVLLISLKAGGTGLTLTAADHVFLLDPWWNPAVEDQAADRVHRIGQTKPVMVYRLVSQDTVEEKIIALQEKKRALAQSIIGEAGAHQTISREELLDLIDHSPQLPQRPPAD